MYWQANANTTLPLPAFKNCPRLHLVAWPSNPEVPGLGSKMVPRMSYPSDMLGSGMEVTLRVCLP